MQGRNKSLRRYLDSVLQSILKDKKSALILGPRQVGKTTLVKRQIKNRPGFVEYPLQNPEIRLDFEKDPGRLIRRILTRQKPISIFIDEAQKIPRLFDAIQYLIDEKKANFILTGSSARKLRHKGVNLLAGRVLFYHLDALLWGELGLLKSSTVKPLQMRNINSKCGYSFDNLLVFGSLPRIVNLAQADRQPTLDAYAQLYLEEEIRAEALSRNIGAFSRFLELAAAESGTAPNFRKLSNDSGVSQPAIKSYYQLLVDTMVAERVEPFIRNSRKRIFSSARYYLFDIGVRNSLARLNLNDQLINAQKGILFEHAVVLELIRRIRLSGNKIKLYYWRTHAGAEVDCILDFGQTVVPLEIKSSRQVMRSEIKGLHSFLREYSRIARHGYVVTMASEPEQIDGNITAIPWNCL